MIEPARSFDLAAEEYERTRPTYPREVLESLPLGADAAVVDVGAGTGKLTRVLVGRYRRVLAVEPLDGMRAILERVVPEAEALVGSAEELPLEDASVDGVVAGQAFHWFDYDRAIPEFARVLRRGGVLAAIANGPDDERPNPLPPSFLAYLEELHASARKAFDERPSFQEVVTRGPFGDVQGASFPHDHVLDRTGLLDNARSVSWIASRPDKEREMAIARLGKLLPEGTYRVPNLATVLWTVRT